MLGQVFFWKKYRSLQDMAAYRVTQSGNSYPNQSWFDISQWSKTGKAKKGQNLKYLCIVLSTPIS